MKQPKAKPSIPHLPEELVKKPAFSPFAGKGVASSQGKGNLRPGMNSVRKGGR